MPTAPRWPWSSNGAPTAAAAKELQHALQGVLGGKVVYEGEWQARRSGPGPAPIFQVSLKANWPQLVFFAGDGEAAGQLSGRHEGDEKELKPTWTCLASPLFLSRGVFQPCPGEKRLPVPACVFPCPDFYGTEPLMRLIGIALPPKPPCSTAPTCRWPIKNRGAGRPCSTTPPPPALGIALAAHQKPLAAPVAEPSAVSASAQAMTATALDLEPSSATATPEVDTAVVGVPSRAQVQASLMSIGSYRGIRGVVHFSPTREPSDGKSIVYFALNRVNKKEMLWISPSVLRQP